MQSGISSRKFRRNSAFRLQGGKQATEHTSLAWMAPVWVHLIKGPRNILGTLYFTVESIIRNSQNVIAFIKS